MILVTGATGHIGNVLVRQLSARNLPLRGLILPGEDTTPLEGQNIDLIEGDVLDYPSLLSAFEGVDVVYHLAGLITIMPGDDPLVKLVNIQGTRNVIQAVKDTGVRRLIYTSSIHALRRIPHGLTIDEEIPFDNQYAISAYDFSKASASIEILKAAQKGMNAVIACPTGVIGPYDFKGSEMGNLILDCLDNKVQIYFDGAYDFVDVRDVAHGLTLIAEYGRCGETYILSGDWITVIDLLRSIQAVSNRTLAKIKIPLNIARMIAKIAPHYYNITKKKPRFTLYSIETLVSNSNISNSKAKNELGYSPRPIIESIEDSVVWLSEYRQKEIYAASPSID